MPATGQLEALSAIFDVLTGDVPRSPVHSPHLGLADRPDASRTHYQLVLLGPTTSASAPPIMVDARFAGFHDAWDDSVMERSLVLFLDELLLPLVEMYGFGSLARGRDPTAAHVAVREGARERVVLAPGACLHLHDETSGKRLGGVARQDDGVRSRWLPYENAEPLEGEVALG